MATRVNKIKTQFTRFNLRYYFSTFQNPNPNELYILNQLSDLLPIKLNNQNCESFNQFGNKEDKIGIRVFNFDYCLEKEEIENNIGICDKLNENLNQFDQKGEKFKTRVSNSCYDSNNLNDYLGKKEIESNSGKCALSNISIETRVCCGLSNGSVKMNYYIEKEKIETRVRFLNEKSSEKFDIGNDLSNEKFGLYSENETRVSDMNKFIFPNDIVGDVNIKKIKEKCVNEKGLFEDKLDFEMIDKVVYRRRNNKEFRQRLNREEMGTRVREVEGFLSPEDKLRGVFLQKMKGKSAIEKALENVGVELTVETLAKVVGRGNLGGDSIVAFFNWAVKQPGIDKCEISCYHIVLKALGRRKLFDFMMGVLRDMKGNGVRPSLGTIEIVMDSYIRMNHLSKAIQIFGNLEEFGLSCDVDSLNVLVGCLCKRSHVGVANGLVNRMKEKIVLDKVSYDIIISGWSRLGKISEMETNLREMLVGGFEPDCLTFAYIIEGLGRAKEIDDAVEVFNGMSERGCVPDVGVYNAMIFNFVSVRDFDKAVEYYRVMLKNECQPNMETYTRLINGFLKARKVSDAVEIFDEMLGRGLVPSPGTVTSFIEPLCSYGPPHAALMIYKKATKVGVKLTLSAYKLLLMRLSRFGKCGMLLNMWDEMQKSGYSSDVEVYEYIINGLSNVGQLENAILVMEESMREGFCPSKLICSKLNHKLMSSDKVETAYKLFLKVRKARLRENERRLWRARGWHF